MGGGFNYSDIPFVFVLIFYVLYVFFQRAGSRMTFALALFFLVWMGLSYVPTGAGRVTERIGEWFYLFFLFAIIQCGYENKKFRS